MPVGESPQYEEDRMQPQALTYWAEFGIAPDKAQNRTDFAKLLEKAKKNITRLARPELLAICDTLKIPPADQDARSLAALVLAAVPRADLIGLHLLLKNRHHAVTWTLRTNKSFCKAVKGIATPKPFTVLLLALATKPKLLKDIYYYAAWCGTSTSARFIAQDQKKQSPLAVVLSKSTVSKLAAFFSKASSLGASLGGTHKLPDGTIVVLLNRHYVPTIKKDYVAEFTVQHGCGQLVLGYSSDDRTLHIKGGNSQLINGIAAFFERGLSYPLLRTDVQIVSSNDHDKFSRAVVQGEVSLTDDLRLVGVAFKRNALTGQPVEIPTGEDLLCIAPTVQKFHEAQLTRGLSLLDIQHFTLVFGAHRHVIVTKSLSNGAIVVTYDNRGIDGKSQQQFEQAVLKQLGLVLHKQMSPTNLPEGKLRVIAYLLQPRRRDSIEEFQKTIVDAMETYDILQSSKRTVLKCSNRLCRSRPISIGNENPQMDSCQQCGNHLEHNIVDLIGPDNNRILSLVDPLLTQTPWSRQRTTTSFEGTEYHELVSTDDRADRSIVLLDAHRLTEATRDKLDRLGKPMVLLNSGLTKSPQEVDRHGVGHLSVPYLVNDVIAGTDETSELLPVLLDSVSRAHRERIHKAARRSLESLTCGKCTKGKQFEQDVYNLLRIIFPHSIRLGREGHIEPDGMIQVRSQALQEDGNISPTACIGYDTKFNENGKGYKLPIEERRKVRDYIQQYQRSRTKFGNFREICAHAFISDNMDETQVMKTVKYLRSDHCLKTDFRCLLITQEFLATIYDLIEQHSVEFELRRSHFENHFYNLAVKPGVAYVPFRLAEANWLFEQTISEERVGDAIHKDQVERVFDQTNYEAVGRPSLAIA